MMINRDNKVVRGRFGGRPPQRLAPNPRPPRFWPEKKRTSWRSFVALWSAAALLGTAYGAGWLDAPSTSKPVTLIGNAPATATPVASIDVDAAPVDATPVEASRVDAAPAAASAAVSFSFCHTGGGYNCVVDGDTIWLKGQKIRIADIDAPETHDPRCPEELALGNQATKRLQQLVSSGAISLETIDRDEDRYGRKLRIVEVNGVSVGNTLVREGLVRWYEGGRRPWC